MIWRNGFSLEALFRIHRPTFFLETPYVTGRRPISRKFLLKCFFLKTYFSVNSLRQLIELLDRFFYFRRICGLRVIPYLSTFSRTGKRFREQGFSAFNAQLLKDLGVQYPKVVSTDSSPLRNSLYHSQAK
jgi:transposase